MSGNRPRPEEISEGSPLGKQSDRDNRANQLNPNNDAYWQSRGEGGRPGNWEVREEGDHERSNDKGPDRKN